MVIYSATKKKKFNFGLNIISVYISEMRDCCYHSPTHCGLLYSQCFGCYTLQLSSGDTQ